MNALSAFSVDEYISLFLLAEILVLHPEILVLHPDFIVVFCVVSGDEVLQPRFSY